MNSTWTYTAGDWKEWRAADVDPLLFPKIVALLRKKLDAVDLPHPKVWFTTTPGGHTGVTFEWPWHKCFAYGNDQGLWMTPHGNPAGYYHLVALVQALAFWAIAPEGWEP